MMINVLEKLAPTAVKALGVNGVLEVAAIAGLTAEGIDLATKGVKKGIDLAKEKCGDKLEAKKQELLTKRAELAKAKAEKAQEMIKQEEPEQKVVEVEAEKVEEAPKRASNKKKTK